MRLTCPNCDAKYEVPDEVVPTEGRDVQCSNCGNTWFQYHPDHAPLEEPEQASTELAGMEISESAAPETVPDETEQAVDLEPTTQQQPEQPADLEPTTSDQADPQEEPAAHSAEDDTPKDHAEEEAPGEEEDQEPQPPVAQPREIDPAVADILQQEAEHEARLRADERNAGLESQPDLGLDTGDEADRRSREARDRMARIRGKYQDEPEMAHATDTGSRRGLLPDIEEINSTLRASEDGAEVDVLGDEMGGEPPIHRSGGFTRGFGVVLVLVLILVLVYSNAGKISQKVPMAAQMLEAYVGIVNQGRVWLDATISSYTPK